MPDPDVAFEAEEAMPMTRTPVEMAVVADSVGATSGPVSTDSPQQRRTQAGEAAPA